MRLRHAAVALALAGCGGDSSETPQERLQGVWGLYDEDGICATALVFKGDELSHYENCELEDGAIGMEISRGAYELAGDELVFRVTEASCEDEEKRTERYDFQVIGSKLTLTSDDGIIVLEKQPKGDPTSARGEYGCWAEDGETFIPGEIRDL